MQTAVIIPAYKPDDALIKLTRRLKTEGLDIIVINDGSGKEYNRVFETVGEYAHVIALEHNCGKGAALKAGFAAIEDLIPGCDDFITADADGQHCIEDILRVRAELEKGAQMVLTVRCFKKDIPLRSRIGNDASRFFYCISTGRFLSDNQSGLRGFKRECADWLMEVSGSKYDYEMGVLLFADKIGITPVLLPIEALYINGNTSSHFKPVPDTIRIYMNFFLILRAQVVTTALYIAAMCLFSAFFGWDGWLLAATAAGSISLLLNILYEKLLIYRNISYNYSLRTLTLLGIRTGGYILICFLLSFTELQLGWSFIIAFLLVTALQYPLYKYAPANKKFRRQAK